ncbi:MAG: type II toxin-antitoxin system RelE/ParE family toxin [Tepidisphaeraceae bacterium]
MRQWGGMDGAYRALITDRAFADLNGILSCIAADSPQNAVAVITRLQTAIDSLEMMPYRFAVARHRGRILSSVRSMPVPPHVVVYQVNDSTKTVHVFRARHGARKRR